MGCLLAGAGGNRHRLMNPQRGCTPNEISSKSRTSPVRPHVRDCDVGLKRLNAIVCVSLLDARPGPPALSPLLLDRAPVHFCVSLLVRRVESTVSHPIIFLASDVCDPVSSLVDTTALTTPDSTPSLVAPVCEADLHRTATCRPPRTRLNFVKSNLSCPSAPHSRAASGGQCATRGRVGAPCRRSRLALR